MEDLNEIKQFLEPRARVDLKQIAMAHILSMTAREEDRELLIKCDGLLNLIIDLTDDLDIIVAENAVLTLMNLSAEPNGARAVLDANSNIVKTGIAFILNQNCTLADTWAMLLSNVSRLEDLVDIVIEAVTPNIRELVSAFTDLKYNKRKCHLNFIGAILGNVTQKSTGRKLFFESNDNLVQRILPFIHYEEEGGFMRRAGAIGLLKNVCFDSTRHEYLLEELKILPFILLPLTGPEEFSDADNDKLPFELQYLGVDKKRESNPEFRKTLLESLNQLCATRKSREYLRENGTYEILRELHKWECTEEGDSGALLACEKVVDILIKTEDEIGEDNLKHLDIPHDVKEKIEKLD